MIDTIVFKIHDLKLHIDLVKHLDKQVKFTGKSIRTNITNDDFTPEQKLLHKTFLTFHDTSRTVEIAHFNKLASSHYDIAYAVDYSRDFISFNCSLPKYAYGSNIQMLMPCPFGSKQTYQNLSSLEYQFKQSYHYMEQFFRKFFASQFPETKVQKSFIEINRIDLCYNQVFPSRQEALEYLQHLKLIKKKYSRDASNYSRSWETSLMYKTDNYSFKCYHKGSEYKVKDRKQHNAINKKTPGTFDVHYLQGFSDRILRYEMTIRKNYMSYLYQNYIFRKECAIWDDAHTLYKTAKTKEISGKYLTWVRKLTATEKNSLKYAKRLLGKTKTFWLGTNQVDEQYECLSEKSAVLHLSKEKVRYNAHFNEDLFSLLVQNFMKILHEFQLEQKKDKSEILRKLTAYNQTVKKEQQKLKQYDTSDLVQKNQLPRKINVTKVKFALDLLDVMTWEEIKRQNIYTDRTWYNIRKDLEFLGVTERTNLNLTATPPFDLSGYILEITFNKLKFRNTSFVK